MRSFKRARDEQNTKPADWRLELGLQTRRWEPDGGEEWHPDLNMNQETEAGRRRTHGWGDGGEGDVGGGGNQHNKLHQRAGAGGGGG